LKLYSNINNPEKMARLKFLIQPAIKINKYSSVNSSIVKKELFEEDLNEQLEEQLDVQLDEKLEESIEEHLKEQIPENEVLESILLKGMRLVTLRLEKKITQKELADKMEIDKTLFTQYEGEIIKTPYATVQRLADFFGVTVEYLTDNTATETISYQETNDLFRDTSRDNTLLVKGLRPEYMTIAEEIQDAGIEVEDVRAFIEMIKKYKGQSL
jgi:transcriptional regulator with XRE-family HTH domain